MITKMRWVDIIPEYVAPEEYNQILSKCISRRLKKIQPKMGGAKIGLINTYCIIQTPNKDEVRVCYDYGDFHKFVVKHGFEDDDLKKRTGITGMEAYDHVNSLFENRYKGMTIVRAFSGTRFRSTYKELKRCVPKQISYLALSAKGKIINGCYRADVCSAFPYEMTRDLPTLDGHQRVQGVALPSEEYPFAFYLKSGHIRIYNELDTHELNSRYYPYTSQYNDRIKKEEEVTILCKRSQYNLKEEFEKLYELRSSDEKNKQYMNACIGYFQRNGDPKLCHLSAVTIARVNHKMFQRIQKIIQDNNYVVYVATDSIIWKGSYSSVAVAKRSFGSFTYEGINGQFFGLMVGAYQYKDAHCQITKCSYLPNGVDKQRIPFGELPEPTGEKFTRDKKGFIVNVI